MDKNEMCSKLTDAIEALEAMRAEIAPAAFLTDVEVFGTVSARYVAELGEQGVLTSLTFTPFGSSAGHFGPSAESDLDGFDCESTDGPFWTAVQEWLAGGHEVSWVE